MGTFVIAEAGVNHNGDIELARTLIDTAAEAGADAVKFQTFRAELVASDFAEKAAYQRLTTDSAETQLEMLRKLELPQQWHAELKERAMTRGLVFLSTAFDRESLRFLVEDTGIDRIKIPSGELTNGPLLLDAALTGLPAILSTGMANLEEIANALAVLAFGYLGGQEPGKTNFAKAYASSDGREALAENVTLLHCTTEYPAPFEEIDLRAMDVLAAEFGLPVGLSDHSQGITVPIAAVARGATVVEKHFTMDRSLPGPDHLASLEPGELRDMVAAIRTTEAALGKGEKVLKPSERANRDIARRSLVAADDIAAGETFTERNVTALRPGTGISPMRYWEIIGTRADRAIRKGEAI